jgi:hypothetical protein
MARQPAWIAAFNSCRTLGNLCQQNPENMKSPAVKQMVNGLRWKFTGKTGNSKSIALTLAEGICYNTITMV